MVLKSLKIRPPLHVSPNNSVARPSIKNLSDNFLTKWPKMSKVCLHLKSKHTFDILGHLVKKLSLRFLKDGLVTLNYRGKRAWGYDFSIIPSKYP